MDALEDIIEKIKAYEKLHAEGESTQTKKNEKEVPATSEMRVQALETLAILINFHFLFSFFFFLLFLSSHR